jgi:RIO kinase 2
LVSSSAYKCLYENGFPVPQPIEQNRHQVVMEFIDAFPLYIPRISNNRRQIEKVGDPAALYSTLMQLILRLASQGLIHGDYNEFNILVYEDGRPILIDFPQMISIDHPNAREYFERDVQCIKTYFLRKFRFEAAEAPKWEDVKRVGKLDFEVEASGYGGKLGKEMEWFHREVSAVTDNYRHSQTEDNDEQDQEDTEGEETSSEEESEDERNSASSDIER